MDLGGEVGSVCTDISLTESRGETGGTRIVVFLAGMGGRCDS